MIIININANFDILYYLSNSVIKYKEQTTFEINTMLYLSQLLSIYDGHTTSKWGYLFTRNKFGAPISMEVLQELDNFSSSGALRKDDDGYYSVSNEAMSLTVGKLEKSYMFEWRTKYILTSIDSILTKSFPIVIDAIQQEPGINLMDKINRTSVLHNSETASLLFDDFKSIRDAVGGSNVNLVVPASLWLDCLAIHAQQEVPH